MSDVEKLYPLGRRVQLSTGETVEIHPWSIRTLSRVTQRVPEVVDKFQGLDRTSIKSAMGGLLPILLDEVEFVICESIPGWTPEQVRDMPAEDALALVETIWDVCLAGPMEKIVGLGKKFRAAFGQPEVASGEANPSPKKNRS